MILYSLVTIEGFIEMVDSSAMHNINDLSQQESNIAEDKDSVFAAEQLSKSLFLASQAQTPIISNSASWKVELDEMLQSREQTLKVQCPSIEEEGQEAQWIEVETTGSNPSMGDENVSPGNDDDSTNMLSPIENKRSFFRKLKISAAHTQTTAATCSPENPKSKKMSARKSVILLDNSPEADMTGTTSIVPALATKTTATCETETGNDDDLELQAATKVLAARTLLAQQQGPSAFEQALAARTLLLRQHKNGGVNDDAAHPCELFEVLADACTKGISAVTSGDYDRAQCLLEFVVPSLADEVLLKAQAPASATAALAKTDTISSLGMSTFEEKHVTWGKSSKELDIMSMSSLNEILDGPQTPSSVTTRPAEDLGPTIKAKRRFFSKIFAKKQKTPTKASLSCPVSLVPTQEESTIELADKVLATVVVDDDAAAIDNLDSVDDIVAVEDRVQALLAVSKYREDIVAIETCDGVPLAVSDDDIQGIVTGGQQRESFPSEENSGTLTVDSTNSAKESGGPTLDIGSTHAGRANQGERHLAASPSSTLETTSIDTHAQTREPSEVDSIEQKQDDSLTADIVLSTSSAIPSPSSTVTTGYGINKNDDRYTPLVTGDDIPDDKYSVLVDTCSFCDTLWIPGENQQVVSASLSDSVVEKARQVSLLELNIGDTDEFADKYAKPPQSAAGDDSTVSQETQDSQASSKGEQQSIGSVSWENEILVKRSAPIRFSLFKRGSKFHHTSSVSSNSKTAQPKRILRKPWKRKNGSFHQEKVTMPALNTVVSHPSILRQSTRLRRQLQPHAISWASTKADSTQGSSFSERDHLVEHIRQQLPPKPPRGVDPDTVLEEVQHIRLDP